MADFAVPLVNFSSLADLPNVYRKAQTDAARQQVLADLKTGNFDYKNAAQKLLSVGDTQGAVTLANLANADRSFQFRQEQAKRQQQNADRSFGLQSKQFKQSQLNADRSYGIQTQRLDLAKEKAGQDTYKTIPWGGALFNTKTKDIIEGPTSSAILDDATLTAMAEQYRAGDTSVLQNLGRGRQGAENVVKLRAKIAELNKKNGVSGAEQAMRNAEFSGVKSGQRTLGNRSANIELAATEFKKVLPVVSAASKAVDRSQYSDLNWILQAYQTRTGDPNIIRFGSGVNTLINLYSRAISPTGIPTVNDKEHARELLSKAWSQGQFNAAVSMMSQEIDAALQSPGAVKTDMRRRFLGGGPTQEIGTSTPNTIPPPPPGFQVIR